MEVFVQKGCEIGKLMDGDITKAKKSEQTSLWID